MKEGFDPEAISDPIFFFDPREKQFIRLTKDLYNDIQSGSLKL